MHLDLFWKDITKTTEAGVPGFGMFSAAHIVWLIVLFAGAATYVVTYKRAQQKRRNNMRKVLAIFLILFEIFKQCVMVLMGSTNLYDLPIEICSFAEYTILIDALWPDNRFFKQGLYYAFLPAAFMALLFPPVAVYPAINFYTIHQLVMHAGIVTYIVARYAADEIKPKYIHIWTTAAAILIFLICPIYFIDNKFQVNYMFLRTHENNPVIKLIWDITGDKGGVPYLLGLTIMGILVFHVMFALHVIIERVSRREKEVKK